MKSLKLDHQLAQAVLAGDKTSTWRLFDDKALSVNDSLDLIDKVDPADKASWRSIGTAHINQVTEKLLGNLTDNDWAGHERFESEQQMYDTYQKYYPGRTVDANTAVKIIHFLFKPHSKPQKLEPSVRVPAQVKLYADGGSRGNPGPSASGYVLLDTQNVIIQKSGIYLGITTNNQAEYQALKLGLEAAVKLGAREVAVHMDSMLVVNQMKGIYKVKNRDLWPIHESIKDLASQLKKVSYTHIPRELNKLADAEVNTTLDAEAAK